MFENSLDEKLQSRGMLVYPERSLVGLSQSAAPLWDLSHNCYARLRDRDDEEQKVTVSISYSPVADTKATTEGKVYSDSWFR